MFKSVEDNLQVDEVQKPFRMIFFKYFTIIRY